MANTKTKTKVGRRNFLIAVSAGSAATAAALVTGNASTQSAGSGTREGKRSGDGYAVSEHINNYYRTAKV